MKACPLYILYFTYFKFDSSHSDRKTSSRQAFCTLIPLMTVRSPVRASSAFRRDKNSMKVNVCLGGPKVNG